MKANLLIISLVVLVVAITGWSIHHSITSRKYTNAFIELGVANCNRITVLEQNSYGYKDAQLTPHPCPKIEEFLKR